MDKDTRNAIERATQQARRLLTDDFALQLEGTFDILQSGDVLAGAHLKPCQLLARDRIVAAIERKRATGSGAADAVTEYLREAAFTTFNRFVALKMLEARGLVQECISKGEQSAGYREFHGLAPDIALLPDGAGYRLYIESLFDELSTAVKVLFDRRDVASVLWPKHSTLQKLLEVLSSNELAAVWSEDETIGWVYQFFNSSDERRKMRDESQAPRNSRELAVRNQFFTPRYVVEFLVDNTLGRTWLEMYGETSSLAPRCRYFVRAEAESPKTRAKKDPRDLRILDPACGSGHFLLYCFDLLLMMYEEAWADAAQVPSRQTGQTLRADFAEASDLIAFRRKVPVLILEHNLHGVDIDPRAAQIAAFSLWLRAQRAFKEMGVPVSERDPVQRTHIVIAEPMPGDVDRVKEFASSLDQPLLGDLFQKMVHEMRLAGELGPLLRVETAISEEVDRARKEFEEAHAVWQGTFPGFEPPKLKGNFNLSGIEDDQFFHDAEDQILKSLQRFTASAVGGEGTRRKLFAGDATQGIALVELLRKRFDVVLMNPPFGEPTKAGKQAGGPHLASCDDDLGAAFVHASVTRWARGGYIGVVSSSTLWFKHTLAGWRQQVLVGDESAIALGAHLGGHVLDNASVGAAATVLGPAQADSKAVFFRCLRAEDKAAVLLESISERRRGIERSPCFSVSIAALRAYRKSPMVYWISPALRTNLTRFPALEGNGAEVRVGVQCSDDPRFVRAWWELPTDRVGAEKDWMPFAKSSEYSPYWDDITWIIRWQRDGAEVRAYDKSRPQNIQYFGRPGVTFPARAVLGFNPRALPTGVGFGHMGSVAFPKCTTASTLLGYLSSRPAEYVLSFSNGSLQGRKGAYQNHYEVGQIADLPWPEFTPEVARQIGELGDTISRAAMLLLRNDETTHQHRPSAALGCAKTLDDYLTAELEEDRRLVTTVESARASLDDLVSAALGFRREDIEAMNEEFAECDAPTDGPWCKLPRILTDDVRRGAAQSIVSLAIGLVLGRFDIRRFGADGQQLPEPNPLGAFEPISLTLLEDRSCAEYPMPPSAMLTVDRADPDFVDRLVGDVLAFVWPKASPDPVTQLSNALQVKCLNDYLSDPGSSGFYSDHARCYSKGRRRAPIYLWLGTTSGAFGVFLLAPATTADTLFVLRNDVLGPRLSRAEKAADEARNRAVGATTSAMSIAIAAADELVAELRAFAVELDRLIPLWGPNVDDGVVVNAAPFYRLMPNRDARTRAETTWQELCNGELEWAHVAMRLWPERVIPKCAADRSLAIAHGLEDVFWVQNDDGKWRARETPLRSIEDLVRERTSPAVKDALKHLCDAPSAPGSSRARRRNGTVKRVRAGGRT